MLNTSATTVGSCLLLLLILIMLLQLGMAMPWWHRNDAGYDASLDPVAWSRAFVQDQVRKPRISQPLQLPPLETHRRSWWSSSSSSSGRSQTSNNKQRKKNSYRKFVRQHRKRRLMLRQTRC